MDYMTGSRQGRNQQVSNFTDLDFTDKELEDYREAVESVKTEYEPKIRALLEAIRTEAQGVTWSPVVDQSDEEYEWAISTTEGEESVYVLFTILESTCREGTLEGIAFQLSIGTEGGRIIGDMAPFNYTMQLWVPVDSPEAIKERWSYFEPTEEVVDSVLEAIMGALL